MRRLLTISLVLAAAVGVIACGDDDEEATVTETVATETTPSVAGEPVDCGLPPPEGGGFFDMFATEVDCATAENVRQAWSTQCAGSDTGVEDCAVTEGFSCTFEEVGVEVAEIACTRADDDAVVTFKTGA